MPQIRVEYSEITYTPANVIMLNKPVKELEIATRLGYLPQKPQSTFLYKPAENVKLNEVALNGVTARVHRVRQGAAPTRSGSADDLLEVAQINMQMPRHYYGTDQVGRVCAPTSNTQMSLSIMDRLPHVDLDQAGGFTFELPTLTAGML